MLFRNYGSFLTAKQKNETVYRYNKPYIKLACLGVCFFCLGSVITAGLALFHATYNTPHPLVPQAAYVKAKASSDRLSKSLNVVKSVHPDNLDVCKVVDTIVEGVNKSNGDVVVENIQISSKTYNIKCVGKDLNVANDFLKALSFDSKKYEKQLTNIRTKNKMMERPNVSDSAVKAVKDEVEFSVVITPRKQQKVSAKPGEGGNK